jgi:hypothetical protein
VDKKVSMIFNDGHLDAHLFNDVYLAQLLIRGGASENHNQQLCRVIDELAYQASLGTPFLNNFSLFHL